MCGVNHEHVERSARGIIGKHLVLHLRHVATSPPRASSACIIAVCSKSRPLSRLASAHPLLGIARVAPPLALRGRLATWSGPLARHRSLRAHAPTRQYQRAGSATPPLLTSLAQMKRTLRGYPKVAFSHAERGAAAGHVTRPRLIASSSLQLQQNGSLPSLGLGTGSPAWT